MSRKPGALASLLLPAAVLAQDFTPTAEHYEAARQGRDCAVYRHLVAEANQKIASLTRTQRASETRLREARARLVTCARAKGARGGENEVLLAELCPSLYEDWLRPSYRLKMLEQDLSEARLSVRLVGAELDRSCPSLPRPAPRPVRVEPSPVTPPAPVPAPSEDPGPAPIDSPSASYDEPGDPFVFVEITRTPAIDLSGLDVGK